MTLRTIVWRGGKPTLDSPVCGFAGTSGPCAQLSESKLFFPIRTKSSSCQPELLWRCKNMNSFECWIHLGEANITTLAVSIAAAVVFVCGYIFSLILRLDDVSFHFWQLLYVYVIEGIMLFRRIIQRQNCNDTAETFFLDMHMMPVLFVVPRTLPEYSEILSGRQKHMLLPWIYTTNHVYALC